MTWIIVEGIDRSGKSSIAEIYKNNGYEIYHMSAPDKKFNKPGYTGPSYLDECLDIYMHFDGKDVLFDRSIYGEMVWPDVYNRKSQLSSEDIEVLRELEYNNGTEYIFMSDPDFDAYWQRCVANNEPLDRGQFNLAVALYEKLEKRFSFVKRQLSDYNKDMKENEPTITDSKQTELMPINEVGIKENKSIYQMKLEEANAINMILSSKIIKKNGKIYENIEKSIRVHLQEKLSDIFSSKIKNNILTDEEVFIFRKYVDRLKYKMENKT